MEYSEVKVDENVWTMIGDKPVKCKVYEISPEKMNGFYTKFPTVRLIRIKEPFTTHRRWPEQLTKTKRQLRIKVFGG